MPTLRTASSPYSISMSEVYDVITVLGVLAVACRTADDLARALARMPGALKPGGKLLPFPSNRWSEDPWAGHSLAFS